jgi:uncharacterized membrane protein YhaH (DUF805 family)
MVIKWSLSHFEGRINCARYWRAVLIILGAMFLALVLLAKFCSIYGIPAGILAIDLGVLSASFQRDDTETATALFPRLATLVMTLVFGWFYAAASIKRLHDRNKSGWWMILFIVAPGLYAQFGDALRGSGIQFFVRLAASIVFIWGFVEMACLKGTSGPNRFGPDPLAPIEPQPRWDQPSELKFVPPGAGPPPGPHVMRGT